MNAAGDRSGRRGLACMLLGLVVVAGCYFVVCWVVLAELITPQRKQLERTPTELGFDDAQPLSFSSADDGLALRGWLVPGEGERVVVLVHGIHSNAWDCQAPDVVRAYVDAGFSVLLFDLRAHGESAGEHAGLGVLEGGDLRAAVQLLVQRGFRDGNIGVHGSSYGAATTLLAVGEIPEIGAVIADSAFADIRDVIGGELERETGLGAWVAKVLMPGMDLLAAFVYSVRIGSAAPERAIHGISPRPILLIHGRLDSVIPFDHVRRLKSNAGAATSIWQMPAGHTQGVRMAPRCRELAPTRDVFLTGIVEFFDRHLGARATRR